MSKHFDYDPETKTRETIHFEDGYQVIQSIQDCSDVVAYNAYQAEFHDKKSDWWFVGSIPMSMCMSWAEESNTRPFTREWQAFVKRKLKDPDFRKLNVNNIRL